MTKVKHSYEYYSGLFLVLGILLFGASIWILGAERQIFARQEPFEVVFGDVRGLNQGAPIRFGGITIGRVAKIGFAPQLSDNRVHVSLLINEEFLERIREDSEASIETQGLLGDKFVSISPGTAKSQILPGAIIRSREAADLGAVVGKAEIVVQNTVEISNNLRGFLEEFRANGLRDITETFKNIAVLTSEMKSGNGILHSLIFDKTGKDTVVNLEQTSSNLAKLSQDLSGIVAEIKSGKGTIGSLIYSDPNDKNSRSTIENIQELSKNLKIVSDSLAQGSGTLGALILDSTVYDNLVEVTDGAKRSLILRSAIRSAIQESNHAKLGAVAIEQAK